MEFVTCLRITRYTFSPSPKIYWPESTPFRTVRNRLHSVLHSKVLFVLLFQRPLTLLQTSKSPLKNVRKKKLATSIRKINSMQVIMSLLLRLGASDWHSPAFAGVDLRTQVSSKPKEAKDNKGAFVREQLNHSRFPREKSKTDVDLRSPCYHLTIKSRTLCLGPL